MTMNRTAAFKLATLAKKINPKIKVIMGGVHPSTMYKQILQNLPVDFIVIGEAEDTLSELMESIRKNKERASFKKVKGIAFKYHKEIIKTPARPCIDDLDKIPFPKHGYFKDQIRKTNKAYKSD